MRATAITEPDEPLCEASRPKSRPDICTELLGGSCCILLYATIWISESKGALKFRLHREVKNVKDHHNPPSFSMFGKACFAAGIAKTLLAVVTSHLYSPSQPKERYIGQHNALEALSELMQTGNLTERRALLEDMQKNHVIRICLSVRIISSSHSVTFQDFICPLVYESSSLHFP